MTAVSKGEIKQRKKGKFGFASMSPEKQRAIASKGGIMAHRKGKGHEWTPKEASAAGRIGGKKRADTYAKI